jgi:septum site-determining protein MinD
MAKVICVHAYHGGTGKTNAVASCAALMAQGGLRVCAVDADVQSPGLHVLFSVKENDMGRTLNDYLWGQCDIRDAARQVTRNLGVGVQGEVYLVPSSVRTADVTRIAREGYDVNLLSDGLNALVDDLQLDVLLIDTHPGMNEETLLGIAMADVAAVLLRPDQQDFQGTSVVVEVARQLAVPTLLIVLNKVPGAYDADGVKRMAEELYQAEVAATIPHSDELMEMASGGIFALRYPDHPATRELQQLVTRALA